MSNKIHVTEYFVWLLQMIKSKGNQFSLCFPCLRKLKKKKSLEEYFAAASEEIMRNYSKDIKPTDFVPSFTSTPTKSAQTSVVGPTLLLLQLHARFCNLRQRVSGKPE